MISQRSTKIIAYSSTRMQVLLDLTMHTAPYPCELEHKHYLKCSLEMGAFPENMKHEAINIFAQSDVSGSMSDICKDGRSKMDHIIHIWTNIIHYIADHPEYNVSLQLRGFDSNIHPYIDLTKITKENAVQLIKDVNNMRPMNTTNIELALTDFATASRERVYSLLMTDGDVTAGEKNINKLASIMQPNSQFAAVAFGTNHNAQLLNTLGAIGPNASNWLVSDLEHSSLVYAEILAKWLHQQLDDVELFIENGLLYDWTTNTWTTTLRLGSLSAEDKKYFHVKSETPHDVKITVRGINIHTKEAFSDDVDLLPELIESETGMPLEIDLTKDIFRLRTQELMFEAKNLSPTAPRFNDIPPPPALKRHSHDDLDLLLSLSLPPQPQPVLKREKRIVPSTQDTVMTVETMKEKLNDFKQIMEKYVNDNQLEEDEFLANLIEDMKMSCTKIGKANQFMYISARSNSQGRQQTQCVVDVDSDSDSDEDTDTDPRNPPQKRTYTNGAYASPTVLNMMRSLAVDEQSD